MSKEEKKEYLKKKKEFQDSIKSRLLAYNKPE